MFVSARTYYVIWTQGFEFGSEAPESATFDSNVSKPDELQPLVTLCNLKVAKPQPWDHMSAGEDTGEKYLDFSTHTIAVSELLSSRGTSQDAVQDSLSMVTSDIANVRQPYIHKCAI